MAGLIPQLPGEMDPSQGSSPQSPLLPGSCVSELWEEKNGTGTWENVPVARSMEVRQREGPLAAGWELRALLPEVEESPRLEPSSLQAPGEGPAHQLPMSGWPPTLSAQPGPLTGD